MRCSTSLQRPSMATFGQNVRAGSKSRAMRRPQSAVSALGPDQLDAVASSLSHLLTMAYEPVVLPCSSLNCGDLVYRSSLDPVLRMETRGINPQGIALLAAAIAYGFIKPGVLPGAVDYYIRQPLQRLKAKAYSKDDFILGKKLASGGFGTVYLAELVDPDTKERRKVVVKKAKEFGEAEVWMNERMMRAEPLAAAEFITGFSDKDSKGGDPPLWLVWAYEGDNTLAELMQKKDFPENAEPLLFGRSLNIPQGPERKAAAIKVIIQQTLECLQACHNQGIVHRDVKPQNMILSEQTGTVKLIDFGAAADLRIGINYVPNQYLLDMRYAPPQKYIMNKYTPRAPPKPLAATLSPVLWNLFHPDRFDMYSVGITILQMACPNLRNDNSLIAFNKVLSEQYNYDLRRWRRDLEKKGVREWAEGLAVLDSDEGAGWDLVCQLIRFNPSDRLSCTAALRHRWFAPTRLSLVTNSVTATVDSVGKAASRLVEVEAAWMDEFLVPNGTKRGGFTEVELEQLELGAEGKEDEEDLMPQHSSETIVWWQAREQDLAQKLNKRKALVMEDLRAFGKQAGKTIAESGRRIIPKGLIPGGRR